MDNSKNNNIIKYIFLSIYIILVGIFYFFTLKSGEQSSKESGFVTDVFLGILRFFTFNKVEFDYDTLHLITRKLVGHYGYNLIIGLFGYLTIYSFKGIGKNTLLISLIMGLFVAVSGELLQYIPANRGPNFIDMMINYGGEVSGILLVLLIIIVINKKKQRQ